MIDREYDVIVVGCGPAGSSTARYCAERGLKTLALDRNLEIGTPVHCGEGLSDNSVRTLKLDLPSNVIARKVKGAVAYAPNGSRIPISFMGTKGYVLERKMFDKWLAAEAGRAGAMTVPKSNVTDVIIEDGFLKGVKANVIGQETEIRSKMVVAADGVESLIARKAGIKGGKNPMFVDSGFQYEMAGLDLEEPDMIILYFGNRIAPRGYVWIFPKGKDVANVGIGIAGNLGGEMTAKKYLDEWISKNPAVRKGNILEVNGGCIPVGNFLKNMVVNGCLGVGDSVNQVNPIHGGGIAESIKAARIAGDVIARAIKGNDVSSRNLDEYNRRWWKERGESLRKVEKVREMFEKMSDDQLNDLGEVLSGEDLVGLAHGKNYAKLAKMYARFKMKGIKRRIGL